jgi:hypothetical protein
VRKLSPLRRTGKVWRHISSSWFHAAHNVTCSAEKIQATSQRLSTLVEGRQWEDVKREAIRLKYLEGIAEAARVWPETSSDH